MKVLVISLARSLDRRSEVTKQLEDLGLPFEIVEGVDGAALSEKELEELCDMESIQKRSRHMSPGAIGCSLSHNKAYQIVVEQNLSHALIVEDDVILPRELPAILDGIERDILDDEVCSLYYRGFQPITFSQKDERKLTGKFRMLFPVDKHNIPISTVGYAVSQAACRNLMRVTMPIRYSSDEWYCFMDEGGIGRFSVVYPRPLGHGDFKSVIDYVESYSSRWHARASHLINTYRIPILWQILKKRRRLIESQMSEFRLSNEPSVYAPQATRD